ncbi:MAG TPA: hypothetical protein VKA92_00470 [Segetibacter sp.]|nr:hypothetical protein [Segetibacter sp.]
MKQINRGTHIYLFLAAWFCSLMVVMIYTSLFYDQPGFQDLLGFGGLLLFACIVLIPFCYLPLMWSYKKLNIPSVWWSRIIGLVVIGNIPIYLLMWKQYEGKMSLPEAKLFLSGYITIAMVYGFLYHHKRNENFIQKT